MAEFKPSNYFAEMAAFAFEHAEGVVMIGYWKKDGKYGFQIAEENQAVRLVIDFIDGEWGLRSVIDENVDEDGGRIVPLPVVNEFMEVVLEGFKTVRALQQVAAEKPTFN